PTPESRAQYVAALVDAVRAAPGVINASTIQTRFILNETMQTGLEIEGMPSDASAPPTAQIRHVMPGIFDVLRIRIRRGRAVDSTDRMGARMVAVVSESFARTYWPGDEAIGKRLRRAGRTDWLNVVGVVDDIQDAGLGVPIGPTIYLPYLQQNTPTAR